MKVILFDLGRTLEDQDELLPGASQMLEAVAELRDELSQPPGMGLVSDFDMPRVPGDIAGIRAQYVAIIERLGIRKFFDPLDRGVTLSTDIGVFKPDERVFRAALDKFGANLPFAAALFLTEHPGHIRAARALGMRAVHFKGPGQTTGDITHLMDFVPLARDFVVPRSVVTAIGGWPTASAGTAAPIAGTSWARFGDDLFLFGTRDGWAEVSERATRGVALRERPTEVPRDHLHLVIQKGRLFQKEHPDIPVLHDRGRFLVVALDPAHAARFRRHEAPCYAVRPLDDRYVAFDTRPREAARTAEVPWVRALINGLSRAEYEADHVHLASFRTRHSTSADYAAAAAWASGQLQAMDYQSETQTITVSGANSVNVIADRPGGGAGLRGVVLVTAHLDSINLAGGPSAAAPGADDNATGSAGVLQIARALRNHPNADDLRFILFGGEEEGLFGSRQYTAGLSAAERGRVRAVVNMDMIGCLNRNPPSVLIEGAAVSQTVIDGLVEAASTYTELVVETSLNPFASDHVPFIERGLPAVLTIEGADQSNSNIHSENDVVANVNYDIALEILRMNLGFVALAVGRVGTASGRASRLAVKSTL